MRCRKVVHLLTLAAVGGVADELVALRLEVREFLREEIESGRIRTEADAWMSGIDIEFSGRLAARGWVGMTIPVEYGGHGLTALERYVVTEELLAAGAPVAAHWIADRQMAPGILRNGTEAQKRSCLPEIAKGERFFAIGMSEPDSGSDLASIEPGRRGGGRLEAVGHQGLDECGARRDRHRRPGPKRIAVSPDTRAVAVPGRSAAPGHSHPADRHDRR